MLPRWTKGQSWGPKLTGLGKRKIGLGDRPGLHRAASQLPASPYSFSLLFPGAARLPQGGGGLRGRPAPCRVPLHGPAAALPLLHHHHLHPPPQVRAPAGREGMLGVTKYWQGDSGCSFPRLLPSLSFKGSAAGKCVWGLRCPSHSRPRVHTDVCLLLVDSPSGLETPVGLTWVGWPIC